MDIRNTEFLYNYLDEMKMNYGYQNIRTILEMLSRFYVECNPPDSQEIRGALDSMDEVLDALPASLSNDLFLRVFDLCEQYERAAFLSGIHVGCRLQRELNG